jgi:hypothetical protein
LHCSASLDSRTHPPLKRRLTSFSPSSPLLLLSVDGVLPPSPSLSPPHCPHFIPFFTSTSSHIESEQISPTYQHDTTGAKGRNAGGDGSRSTRPNIHTSAIRFSPTGRDWAAATTQVNPLCVICCTACLVGIDTTVCLPVSSNADTVRSG